MTGAQGVFSSLRRKGTCWSKVNLYVSMSLHQEGTATAQRGAGSFSGCSPGLILASFLKQLSSGGALLPSLGKGTYSFLKILKPIFMLFTLLQGDVFKVLSCTHYAPHSLK